MHRGPDLSRPSASPSQPTSAPRRRDPVLWLILFGCLLITTVAIGAVFAASGFRARALANNERELENTVLLLSRHFEQQFDDAETAVGDAMRRMDVAGISSPEAFRARMSSPAVREMLQAEVNGLSYVGDLTVVDAEGDFINWSGPGPLPLVNVRDRPYFNALKANRAGTDVVVEAVQSRITQGWTTLVARRLASANGVFLGLLTRRVDPDIYERFLHATALGHGASVTLLHGDGTMLARYPRTEGLIGRKISNATLLDMALASSSVQVGTMISPVDGRERVGAASRISRFPLAVVASRTTEDALADWRSQAQLMALAAALAAIAIAMVFALIIRQISRNNSEARRQLEQEKQRVDTALANMTQGLVMYDAAGCVVMFNQRFLDLLNLSTDIVRPGRHFRDLVEHCRANGTFAGDTEQFCSAITDNIASGRISQAVVETTDGRAYHVIDTPLTQGGWVTTVEDITEHRRLERERDRNHAFLREIIDHIPAQIMVKDARDRRYVMANRIAEQRFGTARDGIIGHTVYDMYPEAAARKITADDDRALSEQGLFLDEHPWQSQTLGLRYITSRRLIIPDASGAPNYLVNVIEDVTERRSAAEKIAHLAHFDALTDLPNRVLFRERIEQELEQARHGRPFALLYIDVDEFKGINDSLGHHVGDELLKTIAGRIRECVRAEDMVARLGGDEFAVLLTAAGERDEVIATVQQLFEAIRRPCHCFGHQLSTDASIGIALAPQDGTELDQLTKNADLAMYAAKASGRRTFRFFEPAMDESARARLQMEQDLRRALAEGQFELHYQPLVGLGDNNMTGCEALLRWRHPDRGMIPPLDFIPLAEDTGLISEIGDWVLRTACMEAATWPANIRLAVNVSPVQLKSPTLALRIASALASSGLASERLEIEITEAVLIRDDEAALKILHQLHEIGVRIALDDFGTGYSSLSYLQRFPFNKIKIDRCFVSGIGAGGSSAIVQAVVNIAAASNMTTTAEGVETGQQQAVLRQLGCTEMQGYLFSAPKPAAEIRKLFAPDDTMRQAS